jgi:hypothetical protein
LSNLLAVGCWGCCLCAAAAVAWPCIFFAFQCSCAGDDVTTGEDCELTTWTLLRKSAADLPKIEVIICLLFDTYLSFPFRYGKFLDPAIFQWIRKKNSLQHTLLRSHDNILMILAKNSEILGNDRFLQIQMIQSMR